MFKKIKQGLRKSASEKEEETSVAPFSFDQDSYNYPPLYQEADEMLQVSLLIYTMTDLRTLAKKNILQNPEKVLDLPLSLSTCLEMIQENLDKIKAEVGDADHEMTMSALASIQERYEGQAMTSSGHWAVPFGRQPSEGFDVSLSPQLIWYGDEKPESDLVYAVGMDPIRKRVTVAFRGSVTPTDFMTDANITLNRRESPLDEDETIGIHHGFHEYLLKERKSGENKYKEIMKHVQELFEDTERRANYRLYVTGHSLGGALATLFAFYAAADPDNNIPKPVTCVSVASPRVGEGTFQRAFTLLERDGKLRHLRIVNEGDPVTIMPKASSKKLWAMMSPASYLAFKFNDKDFAAKETYKHTGIKLKLKKQEGEYEIAYSGVQMEEDAPPLAKTNSKLSFRQKELPGVANHFGNVYCKNLVGVKDELAGMTLNDLYQSKAAAISDEVDEIVGE